MEAYEGGRMEDLKAFNKQLREASYAAQRARKERKEARIAECIKYLVETNKVKMEAAAKEGYVWIEIPNDGSEEFKYLYDNTETTLKAFGFTTSNWECSGTKERYLHLGWREEEEDAYQPVS